MSCKDYNSVNPLSVSKFGTLFIIMIRLGLTSIDCSCNLLEEVTE
jgi:hypothetical protein